MATDKAKDKKLDKRRARMKKLRGLLSPARRGRMPVGVRRNR